MVGKIIPERVNKLQVRATLGRLFRSHDQHVLRYLGSMTILEIHIYPRVLLGLAVQVVLHLGRWSASASLHLSLKTSTSGQPLAHICVFVETPSCSARVMNRRSSHVPSIPRDKVSSNSSMHGAGIVPDNQVPGLLPLHLHHVLVLSRMLQELVDKLARLCSTESLDMMDVRSKIQIHPARLLMELDDLVAPHWIIRWFDLCKVLWGCQLFRMQDGMCSDIFVSQQTSLDIPVETVKSAASICKGSAAPGPRWRELVRQQQGVPSSTRIEAGIDVKQRISLNDTRD
jgi:hypothetical protein